MRRALLIFEIAAVAIFLAFAGATLWQGDEQGELIPLDINALATGPAQEHWFGIFFQDQHVGYTVSRSAATADGGRLYEQRSSFRVATFGRLQEVVTAGAALTDADARLRRFDFFMAAEQVRLTARGEVHADKIVMEVFQAGESTTLEFPVDAPPHVSMSLESVIQRTEMSVGKVLRVPYFDPITMADGEMELEVTDVVVLENGEEAYWLTSRFSGVESRALMTPAGETLRQETALGLSSVRMTADEAQDVPTSGTPTDLISLSAVQVKGQLKNPRDARMLSLRIRGVEPDRVRHQPPMQQVVGDVVTVDMPLAAELPDLPIQDVSDPQWVEATFSLPAAHPELREKAAELLDGLSTRADAAETLTHWVYNYVQKVPSMGVPNGLDVLRRAEGDCNEHTALFVSLARAAGIPTRIAAGVVYSDRIGDRGAFYYHAWPEVRLGGSTEWVPVDPTFGQFPADATHVKLVEGDLDRQIEIMSVMGRLGFELVEQR